MNKSDRLCSRLLNEFGLQVYNLMPATGYWRTSPYSQCYRWEAWATIEDASKLDYRCKDPAGRKVYLGSYDTMTVCVDKKKKLQFIQDHRDPWSNFEVSACTVLKFAE